MALVNVVGVLVAGRLWNGTLNVCINSLGQPAKAITAGRAENTNL